MGADIPDDTVELPADMFYLWELHSELRFSAVPDDDKRILIKRSPLTLSGVIDYLSFVGLSLNRIEVNAIMSIDSILNRFAHDNG